MIRKTAVIFAGLFSLVMLVRATTLAGESIGVVTAGPQMNMPRSGHTATLLVDGRVLITGGMIRERDILNSAELYDPVTQTFTVTGSLVQARVGHTATRLQDGRVLIIGGWQRDTLASAELYDPTTGIFVEAGALPVPRDGFTATLLPDGRVLIAGGYHHRQMLADAYIYDPATDRFSATGTLNTARMAHTATLLSDGRVLIAGGGFDGTVLSSAEIFDPVAGRFMPAGHMTVPRYKHAAILLEDGNVLLVGGSDSRDWRGRYASTELYDPHTASFRPLADMADERFKLIDAIAVLANGKVLIAGGSNIVEIYDPVSNRFLSATGNLDTARFYATATTLTDGTVLIAGGYDVNILSTAATWRFTLDQ